MKILMQALPFFLLSILSNSNLLACSMFKLTHNGHTYVGNNEDSWRTNPMIRFAPAENGKLGCMFLQYGQDAIPEGAFNEAGLVFDGFSVPGIGMPSNSDRFCKPGMLVEIMQTCKTVQDVRARIQQCDRFFFSGGMLLFVDRNGDYLVTEPDTFTMGNDTNYLLANFRPSCSPDPSKLGFKRYDRGSKFLENKQNLDLPLACKLSDTMHECRPGLGDGTLYTVDYDLSEGKFIVFFYHDFANPREFVLSEALKLGPRTIAMAELFEENAEFKRLQSYWTPLNQQSALIFGFGISLALLVLCSWLGLKLLISIFWKSRRGNVALLALCLAMTIPTGIFWAIIMLPRNHAIFYLPAPFYSFDSVLISVMAYWPPLLALLLVVSVWLWRISYKGKAPRRFEKLGMGTTLLTLLVSAIAFGYWGMLILV